MTSNWVLTLDFAIDLEGNLQRLLSASDITFAGVHLIWTALTRLLDILKLDVLERRRRIYVAVYLQLYHQLIKVKVQIIHPTLKASQEEGLECDVMHMQPSFTSILGPLVPLRRAQPRHVYLACLAAGRGTNPWGATGGRPSHPSTLVKFSASHPKQKKNICIHTNKPFLSLILAFCFENLCCYIK